MALEAEKLYQHPEPTAKPGEIILFPTKFEIESRIRQKKIDQRREELSKWINTEEKLESILVELEDTSVLRDIIFIKSKDPNYKVDTFTAEIRDMGSQTFTSLTTPSGRTYRFNHGEF